MYFNLFFSHQVILKLSSSEEMKRSRGLEREEEEEEEKTGEGEEEEEEEGGAHDTITSLAGVKMLQKYNKKMQYRGTRWVSRPIV